MIVDKQPMQFLENKSESSISICSIYNSDKYKPYFENQIVLEPDKLSGIQIQVLKF